MRGVVVEVKGREREREREKEKEEEEEEEERKYHECACRSDFKHNLLELVLRHDRNVYAMLKTPRDNYAQKRSHFERFL